MIRIREIKNRDYWNKIVSCQKFAQFLQSFEWGDFQKALNRKVLHFFVEDKDKLFLVSLIKYPLLFGFSYFYSPRGPVFLNPESGKLLPNFFSQIKKIAKKEKVIFWRFEPVNLLNLKLDKLIKVKDVQPAKTWILNLDKNEDELLKKMHYKTRYNIRLAMRRGIKIRCANKQTIDKDIKIFLELLHQTKKRNKFKSHPNNYYSLMVKKLGEDGKFLKLCLAEYKNKILAANIIIFFGDTVTYLHGASSNEFRNLMAPHLLQWKTIQEAKKLGYKYYDFWGIDEKKWPGITRFKKSFGGQEINYLGTFDFVFNKPLYNFYRLAKKIK